MDRGDTELDMAATDDTAAEHALDARRRIEAAVDAGLLPVWVMEACERWEQAALAYGAAMARRELTAGRLMMPPSRALH